MTYDAILKTGMALEKDNTHEALKYYLTQRDSHPAVLLHAANLAQQTGERDLAFRLFTMTAINEQRLSYRDCAEKVNLPVETILMIDTHGWFGFSTPKLMELFKTAHIQLIETPSNPAHLREMGFKPDGIKDYTHQGISLFEAIKYEACVLLELGHPDLIDPYNADHWPIIAHALQKAAALADYYMTYIKFYQPQRVIYVQGYIIAAATMRLMAKRFDIPAVAIENTCDKSRLMCEMRTGVSVTHNSVGATFHDQHTAISPDTAARFWQDYLANIKAHKAGEHASPTQAIALPPVGDKRIFVYLAQVGTDSSILFGHSFLPTQTDVIIALAQKILADGHMFFIKLHPKEAEGRDPVSYRTYEQLTLRKLQDHPGYAEIKKNPHFAVDKFNTYDSYNIVEQADVCITINSQIGLEAACMGKPVIVCGDCTYGGHGFTIDIKSIDDMIAAIDAAADNPAAHADASKAQKFFYSYLNNSAVEKSEEAFVARVLGA